MSYLKTIPQSMAEAGLCKTFAVRHEVIHIKHIFTEIFVRKSLHIEKTLDMLGLSLFDYVSIMTNRLRRIHKFPREYVNNIDSVIKQDRHGFFPTIELYKGMKSLIALDFDGTVTASKFKLLYDLCLNRAHTGIITANPTVTSDWFAKHGYGYPNNIYACKGKQAKLKKLIDISQRFDYTFYVDNEKKYLEIAWLFGIKTFHWDGTKIKYFSRSK